MNNFYVFYLLCITFFEEESFLVLKNSFQGANYEIIFMLLWKSYSFVFLLLSRIFDRKLLQKWDFFVNYLVFRKK